MSYEWQKSDFIYRNWRDIHYDFRVDWHVPGHRAMVLMFNDEVGSKPWFTDNCTFWLLTTIAFGWIQRIKFIHNSKRVEFYLSKYIYA